ncbi:MAG: T9SS type A sorting domain-containing protein, partial [Bacteroidales bacterium]|nr:T9SS type A sorting domain-containing protein [Bacteroidales bacterium]
DVPGADSYTITIGTEAGLVDIVNNGACASSTYTYTGADWDELEDYYWTVTTVYNAKATIVGDEWAFITACAPTALPYLENFDGVAALDFPACMTVENTNGDHREWKTYDNIHYSSPNAARIYVNEDLAKDDWFFTQGLSLTGGTSYTVDFVYRAYHPYYAEKLAIHWGTSASSAAMSEIPIFDDDNITSTTWLTGSASFTPSTTGTYYVGFHGYSDAESFALYVDDIEVIKAIGSGTTTTWSGTTDNDWDKPGNWPNGVPRAIDDVVIPASGITNYPTITQTAYCNKLTIESGATGSGSLIDNGFLLVGGTTSVERYIPKYNPGSTGWHFLSAPVATQAISPEFVDVTASPMSPAVDFYSWNEEHNYWINIKNSSGNYNQGTSWEHFSNDANPAFEPGKGYLAAYGVDVTKNFTGTLNHGDKASGTGIPALSYTSGASEGWNLIGNPYPSALDWDEGNWNRTNVDGSVYIYDGAAVQYKSWNGSLGGLSGGIIPAMQGFFVKASATGASLTIPQAARVHNAQNFYKSSALVSDLLALKVAGNNFEDEIFVNFKPEATMGFDNQFDAYKLYGGQVAPQLYSSIPGAILSINVLPHSSEEVLVPVGLEVGAAGQYVITVEEDTFWETVGIALEDLKTGIFTDLRNVTQYAFTSDPNDDPNRFVLHFNEVTDIEEPGQQSKDIRFYVYDNKLYVIDNDTENGLVKLFNMLGQPVLEESYSGRLNTIDLPLRHGNYIVQITTYNKFVSGKIFIK